MWQLTLENISPLFKQLSEASRHQGCDLSLVSLQMDMSYGAKCIQPFGLSDLGCCFV
jgi:hypothetical protein